MKQQQPSGDATPSSQTELQGEQAIMEFPTNAGASTNVVEEQQENITFGDTSPAIPNEIRTIEDRTRFLRDDSIAHLGAYLSRPVLINTFTWEQSTTGYGLNSFAPWQLFFNDAHIKSKLNNFARIQCELRLKFVLNASPFYYGLMKVNYDPLSSTRASGKGMVIRSQMPGPYIAPQEMSSVEMKLPFFWPRDYLDVCSNADFGAMGTIDYNVFCALASANSAVTGKITISCYAWAENVHLAAPTSYNALQGPVSQVARTMSNVAGALSSVPPLKTLAQAAQRGAGMVSDLATALGFSNSPNMEDLSAVQVKSFHAFANTEQRMPLDKLSLDPKNEVSLDPSSVGLADVDELAISEFCSHEAMVGICTWNSSDTSGQHEFSMFVTPHVQEAVSYTSPDRQKFEMTPSRYLTRFFKYWRGSMIYRIKIVGTQYHKGRLQITWDPEDDASSSVDTETTNITKIVDLDSEREIEFIVPFKAVRTWNSTNHEDQGTFPVKYGALAWQRTPNRAEHNGVLSIFVQNQLSGPIDPTVVKIVVFARAGPDFEVAVPVETIRRYSPNAPQGPVTLDGSPLENEQLVTAFTVGERVSSIRQFLHRTVCYGFFPRIAAYLQSLPTTTATWSTAAFFPRAPRSWGYESGGTAFLPGLVATGTAFPVNQVFETPVDAFMNCFAGYRGGINWHATPILEDANDRPIMAISRSPGSYQLFNVNAGGSASFNKPINLLQTVTQKDSFVDYAKSLETTTVTQGAGRQINTCHGMGGMSLAQASLQPFVSISLPQYSNLRFQPSWINTRDTLPGNDVTNDTFRVTTLQKAAVSTNRYFALYTSAGTDFNLFYFVCCPALWNYDLPDTP